MPTRMSNHVAAQAAANPTCLAYEASVETDVIFIDSFEVGGLNEW